ncbi:tetratricopeptide repeat protein [Bremerella volcania]|nr:hypothetical protein [Bremerella volcania]
MAGTNEGILLPYAWWDVGLVTIACGIPIGWLIVAYLQDRFYSPGSASTIVMLIGVVLLGTFRLCFWNVVQDTPVATLEHGNLLSRIAAAMTASLGIACTLLAFRSRWLFSATSDQWRTSYYDPWVFAILLLVLVPATYERAKMNSSMSMAFEYVNQSRLAEASRILKRCVTLNAQSSFREIPIGALIGELEIKIEAVKRRTMLPLPEETPPQKRIERAIDLAVLGNRDDALLLLLPIAQEHAFAMHGGHELIGTIYQDRRDWEESLFHFRLATEFWQKESNSEIRHARLAKSIQGQAFALRKLGRISQAETTYLQLLELEPTAERHFLLAQFYEDIQETALATQHAREAIKLSPEQFQSSGEALISKMRAYHFGCFQLFQD